MNPRATLPLIFSLVCPGLKDALGKDAIRITLEPVARQMFLTNSRQLGV